MSVRLCNRPLRRQDALRMMSRWRNSIRGNSDWVRRMGSLEEEMLQLALDRGAPQVFLKKVPDDTSDPAVHCFIPSFPTRDPERLA